MAKRKSKPKKLKSPAIPAWLQDIIDEQRGEMGKVVSLLGCLTAALESIDDRFHDTPYFPEISQLAREQLAGIINQLDVINLKPS